MLEIRSFRIREDFEEDSEENIYSRNTRDDLVDNDEISPTEAGFMDGYEGAV